MTQPGRVGFDPWSSCSLGRTLYHMAIKVVCEIIYMDLLSNIFSITEERDSLFVYINKMQALCTTKSIPITKESGIWYLNLVLFELYTLSQGHQGGLWNNLRGSTLKHFLYNWRERLSLSLSLSLYISNMQALCTTKSIPTVSSQDSGGLGPNLKSDPPKNWEQPLQNQNEDSDIVWKGRFPSIWPTMAISTTRKLTIIAGTKA